MKSKIFIVFLCIAINATSFSQKATTTCKGNCRNGKGVLKTSELYYKGSFYNKLPDGYGFMKNKEWKYLGYFSEGERTGKGKCLYFKDSVQYAGEWKNNEIVYGKAIFPNGAFYVGDFKQNKFHGQGIYNYAKTSEKDFYKGDFKDGYFSGFGTLTYKNGNKDEGIFEYDRFLGNIIGYYYDNHVLYNNDTIFTVYNNKNYAIDNQKLHKISDYEYFYIEKNNEIDAIIVMKENNRSSSVEIITKKSDEELIKHLNKNKFNKTAKGTLSKINNHLYYDENNCLWLLLLKKTYFDENYINFYRADKEKGVFETVIKINDQTKENFLSGIFPEKINNIQETAGYFQQHYHFFDNMKEVNNLIYSRNIAILNDDKHNQGWYEYAKFDTEYDSPNTMELELLRGYYAIKEKELITSFFHAKNTEDIYCSIDKLGLAVSGKLNNAKLEIIDTNTFVEVFLNDIILVDNSRQIYQVNIINNTIQPSDLIFIKQEKSNQYITLEFDIDNFIIQDNYSEEEPLFSLKLVLAFSAFAYSPDLGWVVLNPYFIKKEK